jgi:hypothetical protein
VRAWVESGVVVGEAGGGKMVGGVMVGPPALNPGAVRFGDDVGPGERREVVEAFGWGERMERRGLGVVAGASEIAVDETATTTGTTEGGA